MALLPAAKPPVDFQSSSDPITAESFSLKAFLGPIALILGFALSLRWVIFADLETFSQRVRTISSSDGFSDIVLIWANFLVDYWSNLVRLRVDAALTEMDIWLWAFVMVGGFSASYFASVKWKYLVHALGFWLIFFVVYPWQMSVFFLFFIQAFYLMSHPEAAKMKLKLSAFLAFGAASAALASGDEERIAAASLVLLTVLFLGTQTLPTFRSLRLRAPTLFPVTIFFIAVFFSKPIFTSSLSDWSSAIAFFLFLNFGLRMLFHYFEQRDGQLDKAVGFRAFLAHFTMLPDFIFPVWWLHPGQGIRYLRDVYLKRSQNAIVWDGMKSIVTGILYLAVFVPLSFVILTKISLALGYSYPLLGELYEAFLLDRPVAVVSFLIATAWGFLLFSSSLLGVLHFKVGLYRIFGYDIESYTNYPWIATTFPDFWKRYGLHYMQMILRGYYLPVFLKLKKRPLRLRIAVAAFYAFFVGQFVTWSIYRMDGLQVHKFAPYFLMLSIATFVSFTWPTDSDRKPWTFDWHLPFDVLKVIGIFLFFAIAHLFYHPEINAHGRWAWYLIEHVLNGTAP